MLHILQYSVVVKCADSGQSIQRETENPLSRHGKWKMLFHSSLSYDLSIDVAF